MTINDLQDKVEDMARVISNSNQIHGLGLQENEVDLIAVDLYEKGYRHVGDYLLLQNDYKHAQDVIEDLQKKYNNLYNVLIQVFKERSNDKDKNI